MQRRAAASRGHISIVGTAAGCNIKTGCLNADLSSVASAVAKADVVLAFVGLHPETGAMSAPHNECTEGPCGISSLGRFLVAYASLR